MGEVSEGEEIRKGSERWLWGPQEVLEYILEQDGNPHRFEQGGAESYSCFEGFPR